MALLAAPVCAQETPTQEPELTLEPVIVSAARLADTIQELRRVPGQVYVVTADEIAHNQSRSVQDALRQAVPGIVFYDQVGNSFQQTVDLRGFSGQPSPSVSVFVDGVRVNDPDSNTVNFDLIPIQDVERIEVLPGATALYGRNALAGVINIITKRGGAKPQTTVEGALGSYNHYRLSANTSGPLKWFDYYTSVVWERDSGYRDFSDGRVTSFNGRLGYRPSTATDLSLAYSYANNRLEQAGTLPLAILNQDRRSSVSPSLYENELSSVTFQGRQQLGWGFSLTGNGFYRKTSREGIDIRSDFRGTTDTESPGGALQLTNEMQFSGRTNRLVLGGEFQHSDVDASSTFAGFPFSKHSIDEDEGALFAQETIDLTRELVLTAAVRYDSARIAFVDQLALTDEATKRYERVTPRAGLTYTPWSALSLYFNYGEGFRVPTTDELFAIVGFSNPNLKPVKSRTYEVGLRTRPLSEVELKGALFLTDVKDDIVFVVNPTICSFCGQNQNFPKIRRQGLELTATIRPLSRVDVLLGYSYTEAQFESEFLGSNGFVTKGNRVPLVPMHRINGTLTYRPIDGLELSADALYVSRQVLLNDEANRVGFRLQDYYVLNARVSYTWKVLTAFLRVNNLTNNKYETYGIVGGFSPNLTVNLMPAPGINVLGGLTVRLENYY